MCPPSLSSLQSMMTLARIFKVEVLAISVKVLYVQKEVWTDRCVCPWWIFREEGYALQSHCQDIKKEKNLSHRKDLFGKHGKRLAGFHSLGIVQFSEPNFLVQGRWRWPNGTKEGSTSALYWGRQGWQQGVCVWWCQCALSYGEGPLTTLASSILTTGAIQAPY